MTTVNPEYLEEVARKRGRYVFLVNELKKLKPGDQIDICGARHEVVSMASYMEEHYPESEYLKIYFRDGTALQIYDEEPFYESEMALLFHNSSLRNFDEKSFGDYHETLIVDGIDYSWTDDSDKQHLKKIFFGEIEDSEDGFVASTYIGEGGFWLIEEDDTVRERFEKKDTVKGRFVKEISVDDVKLISWVQ